MCTLLDCVVLFLMFNVMYLCLCETQQTKLLCVSVRVTGGELFEDIVAREYYSEADAR